MRTAWLATAATAVLSLAASGCVTVHGELAVVPSVKRSEAAQALTGFVDAYNAADKAYDPALDQGRVSGALGQILDLSAAGQNAGGGPQVALDGVGNAMFAWSRSDGSSPLPDPCCTRVQVRPRSAGGALGSVETLSAAGEDGGFQQIAVNDAGQAVATWAFRSDGTSFVIQAAAGP